MRLELGGYVVGALGLADGAAVNAHVSRCGACRRELADLAPLPGLLRMAVGDR